MTQQKACATERSMLSQTVLTVFIHRPCTLKSKRSFVARTRRGSPGGLAWLFGYKAHRIA